MTWTPETGGEVEIITASDGYPLHLRRWRPAGNRRGQIVALHGIQSHGGWYGWSSHRLALAGWEVIFLDRRGSGLNEPDRGHVAHSDRLVYDVLQSIGAVRSPALPLVLMSVSWGGRLAAVVAQRRPEWFNGLALLYPGIFTQLETRWDQRLRLALAETMGLTRRKVKIPLSDPALFTSNPEAQAFIRSDPLALHEVTVGFLLAHLELQHQSRRALGEIRRPSLCLLAGRDRIIDNQATRRALAASPGTPWTIKEYPTAEHTLEFEDRREEFLSDLLKWLEQLPLHCVINGMTG